MQIGLRPTSNVDFEFIHQVTKAAMQTYVEQTWGSWVDDEQRMRTYNSIDLSTHQIIQLGGQDIVNFMSVKVSGFKHKQMREFSWSMQDRVKNVNS